MVKIINGQKIAEEIYRDLRPKISRLATCGIKPALAVIYLGQNELLNFYLRNKKRIFQKMKLKFKLFHFKKYNEKRIKRKILELNRDKNIQGIMVQLPLSGVSSPEKFLSLINPEKDVDRLNRKSKIFINEFNLRSPVIKAIIRIIKEMRINLKKDKIVIRGRGFLVGRPLAEELRRKKANFEIVDLDTETRKRKIKIKNADLLISATGRPNLIKSEELKEGASVIDAGTSIVKGRLVGDIKRDEKSALNFIAPSPGGVGPLSIAYLVENLIILTELQLRKGKI